MEELNRDIFYSEILAKTEEFFLGFEREIDCDNSVFHSSYYKDYFRYIKLFDQTFKEINHFTKNSLEEIFFKFNRLVGPDFYVLTYKKEKRGHQIAPLYISVVDTEVYVHFKELTESACYLLYSLLELIDIAAGNLNRNLKLEDRARSLKERLTAEASYPLVVLSGAGEILFHTLSFLTLGLSSYECAILSDGENIELGKDVYKVFKSNFNFNEEEYYCIGFLSDKNAENRGITTGELGIISGSIAHELKNPLAGIMTAASLLELEEGLGEEEIQSLKEMKVESRRCKYLVDTFLGFSKTNPVSIDEITIEDSLSQAINLLRFRMIEQSVRIDVHFYQEIPYENDINSSILSMIIYLVLSEILNIYSHFNLIAENEENIIAKVIICESFDSLVFKIGENEHLEKLKNKIDKSKLINHLCELQEIRVSFCLNYNL